MKSFRLLLGVPVIVLTSACTYTGSSNPAHPIANADPNAPGTITCRRVMAIGTRISSKECRRNREWEDDDEVGRAYTEALQRKSAIQHDDGK